MIPTLIRNWWLLALCGILEALYSFTNLFTQGPDGSLTFRRFLGPDTVRFMSKLVLGAGVCTIAAGLWSSGRRKSWLLALNGLALTAFGLIFLTPLPKGRLSFLPVALLFVVMAMSMGVFALAVARTLRRHIPDQWFLGLAGIASIGFALAFLALGLRWVRLEPLPFLIWMSSYFAFSAICMLGMGLRLNGLRAAIHRMAGGALPG